MTIKEALKRYHQIEIDLLISHVLGKPKEFLFMNPEFKITKKQYNNLTKLIKRRQKGEPMAYILGYRDFYGFRFKVNKDVLIPRPETEWLIDKVKNQILKIKITNQKLKILDIGTGSGCIIISLAHELKAKSYKLKADLYASDISKKALDIAKINAKKHHPYPTLPPRGTPKIAERFLGKPRPGGGGKGRGGIKFIQSDLFAKIKGKFDIIIVNLPYVPLSDYKKLKKNLKFEPKIALSGGKNTWELYQKFFQQLPFRLNPGAVVLLEIDPKSKKFLLIWTKKFLPKAKIKFYRDLNNLWRYMEILF